MNRRRFLATLGALFTLPIFGSRLRPKNAQVSPWYSMPSSHSDLYIWDDPVDVEPSGRWDTDAWLAAELDDHPMLRMIREGKKP